MSAQESGIRYAGPKLAAKTACSWKVKLWIDGALLHESENA